MNIEFLPIIIVLSFGIATIWVIGWKIARAGIPIMISPSKKDLTNNREIQKQIEENEKEINRLKMRLSVLNAMQKLVVKNKKDLTKNEK